MNRYGLALVSTDLMDILSISYSLNKVSLQSRPLTIVTLLLSQTSFLVQMLIHVYDTAVIVLSFPNLKKKSSTRLNIYVNLKHLGVTLTSFA